MHHLLSPQAVVISHDIVSSGFSEDRLALGDFKVSAEPILLSSESRDRWFLAFEPLDAQAKRPAPASASPPNHVAKEKRSQVTWSAVHFSHNRIKASSLGNSLGHKSRR